MNSSRPTNRSGLTLLIVLGMLFLFSVISVSFVIFSRQSQEASVAIARSKLRKVDYRALSDDAVMSIIRGGRTINNAFTHHSLLGDVYDSSPIRGNFRPIGAGNTIPNDGVFRVNSNANDTFFLKIPLPRPASLSAADTAAHAAATGLPVENDALTGRLITFLEGPLQNQTFRILRYVGGESLIPDNNSPDAGTLNYSVLISLIELESDIVQYTNRSNFRVTSSINNELLRSNNQSICYDAEDFSNANTYALPYSYIINGGTYNGNGTGLVTRFDRPQYDNFNSRVLEDQWGNIGKLAFTVPDPNDLSQPADPVAPAGIPLQILHRYLYELDSDPQEWQSFGSNEGFDVPDFRDWYLGYYPPATLSTADLDVDVNPSDIIPTMHRPAVINYIVNRPEYNNPANLSRSLVLRMLNLLDFATPRPLNMQVIDSSPPNNPPSPPLLIFQSNSQFLPTATPTNVTPALRLDFNGWPAAGPAPPAQFQELQRFVSWLTNGPYDVDNDGEGIADSVWLDLDLPSVTGPDGQTYRALAAVQIRDHESRINVNTAGDITVADDNYLADRDSSYAPSFTQNLRGSSQGLGYGPSDIALSHVLRPQLGSTGRNYDQVLDFYRARNTNITLPNNVNVLPGEPGNDLVSRFFEFANAENFQLQSNLFAFPLIRRPNLGISIDRFGAPRLTTGTFSLGQLGEEIDDPYELSPRSDSRLDHLFSFAELDRLVSEFDSGISMLPDRFVSRTQNQALNANFRRLLTTRSAELKNIPLTGVFGVANNDTGSPNPLTEVTTAQNTLGLMQLLHEAKYRYRGELTDTNGTWAYPAFDPMLHDPPLNNAVLEQLFPVEFRHNLPLNLNRPFAGNIALQQLYFRNLYCLAQLIIPRDHILPGMEGFAPIDPTANPIPPATLQAWRIRARIIAQWVANVIEFHDGGSVMSQYNYDEFPFGLRGVKQPGWIPQPGNVVWGMEFPEIVFSESFSMHDVRQFNDSQDRAANPDQRGQFRIPQGSTFMEFFVPRPTTPNSGSLQNTVALGGSGLYDVNTGELDLGRMAGTSPVWRVGFSIPSAEESVASQTARSGYRSPEALQLTYQVESFSDADSNGLHTTVSRTAGAGDEQFERIAYFTQTAPGGDVPNLINNGSNNENRVFNLRLGDNTVPGGSYFVIAPREGPTYFGSQQETVRSFEHMPSPQRIVVDTNAQTINTFSLDGENLFSKLDIYASDAGFAIATKPTTVAVLGAAPPSTDWPTIGFPWIGLNISEPLPVPGSYYMMPTDNINPGDVGTAQFDGFGNREDPATMNVIDDGYANYSGGFVPDQLPDASNFDVTNEVLAASFNPGGEVDASTYGTRLNVRTAYLQRLANPNAPYDQTSNPYITVDAMSLDLTLFNGEDEEPDASGNTFALASRYRDGSSINSDYENTQATAMGLATAPDPLMSINADDVVPNGQALLSAAVASIFETPTFSGVNQWDSNTPASPSYLNTEFGVFDNDAAVSASSLGYLNVGRPLTDQILPTVTDSLAGGTRPTRIDDTFRFFDGFGLPTNNANQLYIGAPAQTVASLFWFDRPFSSPLELQLVPYAGPGTFTRTFGAEFLPAGSDRYNPAGNNTLGFPHLLNFFDSVITRLASPLDQSSTPGTTDFFWSRRAINQTATDLALLLDFVETPVFYADSAFVHNPQTLTGGSGGNSINDVILDQLLADLRETFFGIQDKRVVPGKISLNTISDPGVWHGLEFNYLRTDADRYQSVSAANELVQGLTIFNDGNPLDLNSIADFRRGYTPNNGTFFNGAIVPQNPNLNSLVPTQFASAAQHGTSGNIINPIMRTRSLRTSIYNARAANASLLRQASGSTLSNPNEPLLDPLNTVSSQFGDIYEENIQSQAFAKFQRMLRLPNMTTKQSNVFEVRLTIGLFEFDPSTGFGAEVLDGAGKPARHQAVYFIDRSIPVGFAPGENINVDKTILYRRHLD